MDEFEKEVLNVAYSIGQSDVESLQILADKMDKCSDKTSYEFDTICEYIENKYELSEEAVRILFMYKMGYSLGLKEGLVVGKSEG